MFQLSKAIRFTFFTNISLSIGNGQILQYIKSNVLQHQIKLYSTCSDHLVPNENKNKEAENVTKASEVALINLDGSITVTDVLSVKKIANDQNLTLVKVLDPKNENGRCVYKLESPNEKKHNSYMVCKNTKVINVRSKINEHDLDIKIKHANKLLGRKHIVKFIVLNTETDNLKNSVHKAITEKVEGHLHNSTDKKHSTIYNFYPFPKEETDCIKIPTNESKSKEE